MSGRLEGRAILVVGASAGIGRASGLAAAAEGARVAFAARRVERLEEVAAEAGGGSLAVACDVADEGSCRDAVAAAVEGLGGLDAIVYSPGIGIMKPIEDIGAEEWHHAFGVNVVGASMIARHAIPHLRERRGKAVFVSSISIDDQPPRPSFAPYVVTKIALEALVRAWQGEHRAVSFSTVATGDTITEFGVHFDPAVIMDLVQRWIAQDYMYGRAMDAYAVAEQVVNVLASRETIRRLAITPSYGDTGEGYPDLE